MSAICTGCDQTSDRCQPTCPLRTQPLAAPGPEPVASWLEALGRWLDRLVELVVGLPYQPGEVDPRPLLGGWRAPSLDAKPRPVEREPVAEPAERGAHKHAAGSRSDLRPVRDLLDAARRDAQARAVAGRPTELIPLIDPPLAPHAEGTLAVHGEAAVGPEEAELPTEPIPLGELPLLSHVGVDELAADTRARNRAPRATWSVEFVGFRPGPGWPGLIRMSPPGGVA